MNKKEKSYKIVTIGSYIIAVMFYAAAALALMGENTIMGMFYLSKIKLQQLKKVTNWL